jgi:acetyl esterase/lipase
MFDPDVDRLLAAIALKQPPPLEQLDIATARQLFRESCAAFNLPAVALPSVEDRLMPDGSAVRVYRPVAGAAELPWLFYLHGGGWVLGDLDTHDAICRTLARESRRCVIALDYPLAPEHPFPAALDSVMSAIASIRANPGLFRIDPAHMAIGGDSAGGALAASACLTLRESGLPQPALQLLFYPATDLTASSDSYARVTSLVPLTASRMRWFLGQYLHEPGQALDWRASPLRAASLSGLPPAFVVTAGHDPLRDEGIAYAHRLEADGVRVTHLHFGDQIHGFLTLGRALRRAGPVLEHAARELTRF